MQGEEPEFTNGDCPFWRYEDRVKDPPNDAQNSLSRDAERIAFSRKPFSQYPFFTGMAMASGCRPKAAGIFVGIGAFSILLGNVRICVGPPRLTSWVGQHVYLTQAGMINLDAEKLASGYIASPKHAGTLRLKVTGGKEEYKIGDDTREGSEEEMLGEQTAGSE
ncbi:hypothetical protein HG530_001454 [Fusarium avenaceum]|nr:hypothetical protein HG530_001454 [Fusarium avenaceum]